MPVHLLPEEMKLKTSSEVKIEASTRTKQSKIRFKQQINLDRLKTLAITHTEKANHSNSAPPEEDEQMQPAIRVLRTYFLSLHHGAQHVREDWHNRQAHSTLPSCRFCSVYGGAHFCTVLLPRLASHSIAHRCCGSTQPSRHSRRGVCANRRGPRIRQIQPPR